MRTFRILYFHESVLDHAEEIQVRDVLEAIEEATRKETQLRAEVWTKDARVAEVPSS